MNEQNQYIDNILIEANNHNTSGERLAKIYHEYRQHIIKQALTSNPNTPLEILLQLAEHYPSEFLANPVLDLYFLSNPNFLTQMPENAFISILKLEEIPKRFVLSALNRYWEREKILHIIISRYLALWNQWRKDNPQKHINLANFYLKNANLKNANLQNAKLQNTNLQNTNLQNTYLQNTNLESSCLENSDLKEASLKGSNLENANLKGANLQNVRFNKANLKNTNLKNANLQNAILNRANLQGVKLNENTIVAQKWYFVWNIVNNPESRKNLQGANLEYANLENMNLKNINLENANLEGANLEDANLYGANLKNVNLKYANLSRAILNNANLENTNFKGVKVNFNTQTDEGICLYKISKGKSMN